MGVYDYRTVEKRSKNEIVINIDMGCLRPSPPLYIVQFLRPDDNLSQIRDAWHEGKSR